MASQEELRFAALRTHALVQSQQHHICTLRTRLQTLEAHLAKSTAHSQDAISTLAQSECTQLCTHIATLLPRELRDIIYTHLLSPSPIPITREYFRSGIDPLTKSHSYDPAQWKATHFPQHYWSEAYVTAPFLSELVERYYHTSTFTFNDDEGVIERFLSTDHFNLDSSPVELVNKIEVELSAMTYDQTTCIGYMFGSTTKPERLEAAIKGLEMVRGGSVVVVRFATRAKDEEQRMEQVLTARKSLVPGLRGAKQGGCDVRFLIDGEEEVNLDEVIEDGH